MKYRTATVGIDYPKLSDEDLQRFVHELANCDVVATHFFQGQVHPHDDHMAMFGEAYLMHWKWSPYILMQIAKHEMNPEPDFVEFIHDMVVRLNLIPYDAENKKNNEEFEKAMEGRLSLVRTTKGKYAFQARIAYEAWVKAHNRGKPYVE